MKWRRKIRGLLRAAVHVFLVFAALYCLHRARSPVTLLLAGAGVIVTLFLLVRAAYVYIPGFDPFFRTPWRGPSSRRRMAITFDDGPNGDHTLTVLRLLAAAQAKATFFLIGENVQRAPHLARLIAAQGHAVGSHTYSHQKLSQLSGKDAQHEIDRGHQALIEAGVGETTLFRAPHGLKTFAVTRHLRRRGLRLIAWTAGVFDTDCRRADVIVRRARPWLRPGSILLLHDGKWGHDRSVMTAALQEILAIATQRKLELVTVPELLGSS